MDERLHAALPVLVHSSTCEATLTPLYLHSSFSVQVLTAICLPGVLCRFFQVAVFLAPAVAIPMLLFSGFVVTLKAMPSYLHWISYVSFVRYAYEGCILSVYGFDRPELECDEQKEGSVPCLFTEPSEFVSFLGLNVVSVEVCAGALIVFVVLLNVATYVALKMRVKRTF